MPRFYPKLDEDYTTSDKRILALFAFVIFGVIGNLIGFLCCKFVFSGADNYLPYGAGLGTLAAISAYYFPRKYHSIMHAMGRLAFWNEVL